MNAFTKFDWVTGKVYSMSCARYKTQWCEAVLSRLTRWRPGRRICWTSAGLAVLFFATDVAVAQDLDEDRLEVVRMLNDAGRALSARNATRFLSYFDKSGIPKYFELEAHIEALTTQADIASSIRLADFAISDKGYHGTVDWILQLTRVSAPGKVKTRRMAVRVSVVRSGKNKKRWRIEAVTPIDFFRPL